MEDNDKLQEEFDEVFEDDEKASAFMKLTSSAFTRRSERIKIKQIGFTDPIKKGRQSTASGLTATIHDLGVVTPIHVMTVPEESADEDYKYVLIDGLRRVYGSLRNNNEDIDAIVWDFKDKDQGTDMALFLSLLLNRTQRRQWNEIWHLYQVLEMQSAITPGTLEYLLQLESGDAMKLKDVMLCEYDEVKQALLNGEKNLDACYKMLAKLRKEEDQLAKDDVTGVDDTVEGAEELKAEDSDDRGTLSEQDVLELLEMADNLDDLDEVGAEDFDDLNKVDDSFIDAQKVGERHPLDQALRNAVLQRDKFTCQCCGMKLIGARLGLTAIHHVICVHSGGRDELGNLTTLCVACHIALHIMERGGGSIMMSQEDFETLSDNEQLSLKKALKLARIAIEADKRRGLSKEDVKQATQDAIRHPMPGVGLKENQQAYAQAKAGGRLDNSIKSSDDNEE